MLKIKLFIILFILFFSTNLQARTVGNYVGIDLIKTNLSFSMESTVSEPNHKVIKSRQTVPSSMHSFGFKYNYALNYRGFFISPGLIYEKNNVNNPYNYSSIGTLSMISLYGKSYSQIAQRYGVKLDLGGDINNDISIYGTVGHAINNYETYGSLYPDRAYFTNTDTRYTVSEYPFKLNKGRKSAPFFGGGFRIKLYKNWLLNGEYNFTRFTIDTKASEQTVTVIKGNKDSIPVKMHFNNNINIFKLGINYNF